MVLRFKPKSFVGEHMLWQSIIQTHLPVWTSSTVTKQWGQGLQQFEHETMVSLAFNYPSFVFISISRPLTNHYLNWTMWNPELSTNSKSLKGLITQNKPSQIIHNPSTTENDDLADAEEVYTVHVFSALQIINPTSAWYSRRNDQPTPFHHYESTSGWNPISLKPGNPIWHPYSSPCSRWCGPWMWSCS